MIVETSFNKATLATADSQQPSTIKITISEPTSKDGESVGEATIVVIQTTANTDEKQGE